MYEEDAILGFFDNYRWLSNFYPVDIIDHDGDRYPSVEHAYQAYKTFDNDQRKKFMANAPFPLKAKQAKYIGSQVNLRPDWTEETRIATMKSLLQIKFQHPSLRKKLLETGDRYIEETNNWKDTFWGVCNGTGRNVLGNLIMHIRSTIREEERVKALEASLGE